MKKHFAKISDLIHPGHPGLPDDLPDPLGERGSVFDQNEAGQYAPWHQDFLRQRAREMRSAHLFGCGIIPCSDETRELLQEGMSFSIHDRRFSVGVYARPLPSEVVK